MRYVSWNVNGLRAVMKKGFEDIVAQINPDVLALQETKLQANQAAPDLPDYLEFWSYAERKGYSGTAVFSKRKPLQVLHGLGFANLDDEGRIVALEFPECWFVCVYTPNAQNGLARIDHRMEWDDAFRDFCKGLEEGVLPVGVPVERVDDEGAVVLLPNAGAGEGKNGADIDPGKIMLGAGHIPASWLPRTEAGETADAKPVVVCGDLNVAHNEIDLKNPGPNRGNAGFSDEERGKFGEFLDAGFTDTFRYLHPDVEGAYSWWSYRAQSRARNVGWRIDYFIVSERLRERIENADILPEVMGSDHCPVLLELKEEN